MRLGTHMQTFRFKLSAGCVRPPVLIVAALSVSLFVEGCGEKRLKVRPWETALTVRPLIPIAAPGYKPDPPEASAPNLAWELPAPPSALNVSRQPVRPRVPVQTSTESGDARRPAAPSLEPELSPQEIALAQQQMSDSVAIAQKNLDLTKGHKLGPIQADLGSKVISFLQESREAARQGDWARARNLAKKAQVLSEELAASF
jgi:hypothetical protein